MAFNRGFALRAATHLAAWLPFLYGAASALQHQWRPSSDDAGIAIRSWDVLTSYGPLLGQPSRLARGVYDAGPIQYWLLTVPVHIEPRAGALWGAALWCMVACSLAIEAARSAARAADGLLASAALLGAVLWIPDIGVEPLWNPWFGLMFFLAALAAAWAVVCGRRGWWPVLIIAASIAAQAHLMYAIACGALVLLALIVGLTETIRARDGFAGYRWLIIGMAAGLICWSAPLLQQFTSRHGNLSALLHNSRGGTGPKGGITFGLQALAGSTQPPPVWWTLQHIMSLDVASSRPVASGVVALALIVAVLVAALWLRARRTAAIAAVGLLVSLAAMITYAFVPAGIISQNSTTFNSLTYLIAPMFAVGAAAWITVISGVVLVARRAARRAPAPAAVPAAEPATVLVSGACTPPAAGPADPPRASPPADPAARLARAPWALPAATLAAVCVLALASLLAISQQRVPQPQTATTNTVDNVIRSAAQKIQAKLPGQPIELLVRGRDRHYRRRVTFGLAYALDTTGYRPEVTKQYAWQLGPEFSYTGLRVPTVTVHMYRSGGIRVVMWRHAAATHTGKGG